MHELKKDKWQGYERRTCPNAGACLDHAGLVEQIKNLTKKAEYIEHQNYVPFSNYKWAIGILSSVLVSLFSISIYLALETTHELNSISTKQETTIYKISDIQTDLLELKRKIEKP